MDKVKFGFFPEFLDPTILFHGSNKALKALHQVLMSLEENKELKLENDDNFIPLNGIKLTLSSVKNEGGMRIKDLKKSIFKWNLSKDDAASMAEKLSTVINSKVPCHHYLDGFSDDVEVVVSTGEYPDTFLPLSTSDH